MSLTPALWPGMRERMAGPTCKNADGAPLVPMNPENPESDHAAGAPAGVARSPDGLGAAFSDTLECENRTQLAS